MNLLEAIRAQFAQMEWADSKVWRTVARSDAALTDQNLMERIYHIHQVQHGFRRVWRQEPRDPRAGTDLRPAELALWAEEGHRRLREYAASLSESDLERPIAMPWAEAISGRSGSDLGVPTLAETCLQLAAHSTYHRGQVNMRLRQLGVEPPLTDFIAWIWLQKPEPDWSGWRVA